MLLSPLGAATPQYLVENHDLRFRGANLILAASQLHTKCSNVCVRSPTDEANRVTSSANSRNFLLPMNIGFIGNNLA